MAKKLIRLTESDLHHIVTESVNKILTELDWKTYMNAARGRQQQGNYDAANNLSGYANAQFQKKHFGGMNHYSEVKNNNNGDAQINHIDGRLAPQQGFMRDIRQNFQGWNNPNRTGGEAYMIHSFGDEYPNGYSQDFHKDNNNTDFRNVSNAYNQKVQDVGNDMNGYYNGKSRYVKGKGWTN